MPVPNVDSSYTAIQSGVVQQEKQKHNIRFENRQRRYAPNLSGENKRVHYDALYHNVTEQSKTSLDYYVDLLESKDVKIGTHKIWLSHEVVIDLKENVKTVETDRFKRESLWTGWKKIYFLYAWIFSRPGTSKETVGAMKKIIHEVKGSMLHPFTLEGAKASKVISILHDKKNSWAETVLSKNKKLAKEVDQLYARTQIDMAWRLFLDNDREAAKAKLDNLAKDKKLVKVFKESPTLTNDKQNLKFLLSKYYVDQRQPPKDFVNALHEFYVSNHPKDKRIIFRNNDFEVVSHQEKIKQKKGVIVNSDQLKDKISKILSRALYYMKEYDDANHISKNHTENDVKEILQDLKSVQNRTP